MSQKISDMNVIPSLLAAHKVAIDQPEVPGVSQYAATIQQILDLALAGSAFWPLAGSADLTNDVTIDGNGHDLIFGSPNPLANLTFEATEIITVNSVGDYISNVGYIELGSVTTIELFADEGTVINANIDNQGDALTVNANGNEYILGVGETGGDTYFDLLVSGSVVMTADDGVDSSSLTLTPLGLSIDYIEGGESTLNGSWNILGQSTWDINLGTVPSPLSGLDVYVSSSVGWTADDGVDSSNISLLPTGFVIPHFTVAGQPSASPANKIGVCTDESGGRTVVLSDGTDWRRVYDNAIIS